MAKIKGIYAAGMSVLNEDLSLNVEKTISHSEKIIDLGCHGVAIFGSTGQAQLISIAEKIDLLNQLSLSKYKKNFLVGTGMNSLTETINLMKISLSLGFKKFLIMPPAYYKYGDSEVITFYSKIVEALPESEIIVYNFEKLSGYKFSVECVEKLVTKFPDQIIGVKDSSYNLYEKLKINNFSILPGSESKLLKGLSMGCSGVITATCNVTANLSRKVFDDFHKGKENISTELLNNVRGEFDKYNLISALHTYFSKKEKIYQNVIPPLSLMNKDEKQNFFQNLNNLNFSTNNLLFA